MTVNPEDVRHNCPNCGAGCHCLELPCAHNCEDEPVYEPEEDEYGDEP